LELFLRTIASQLSRKKISTKETEHFPLESQREESLAKILEEIKLTLRDLPSDLNTSKRKSLFDAQQNLDENLEARFEITKQLQGKKNESDIFNLIVIPSLVQDYFPWIPSCCKEIYTLITSGKSKEADELIDKTAKTIILTRDLLGGQDANPFTYKRLFQILESILLLLVDAINGRLIGNSNSFSLPSEKNSEEAGLLIRRRKPK
jgi:hypothetical protein